MRFFLILIVLGGLGGGGWYLYQKQRATSEPVTPPADQLAPRNDVGPAAPPQLDPESPPPADIADALARAEALWAAAGEHPATSAQAPAIALAFSDVLRRLYNQPGQKALEQRLMETRLTPLGDALFFSRAAYPNDSTGTFVSHKVTAADKAPDVIARRFGISYEFFNRLRGRPAQDSNLAVGAMVKLVNLKGVPEDRRHVQIHIDLGDYLLDCYVAGIFAKRYQVAIGADSSPTPTGKTKIDARVWHPEWTHPDTKQVLPYGHADNILGPVWMRFDGALLQRDGIGIHGYSGPDAAMGVRASHGCIRMRNEQAEELFCTVPIPERTPTLVEIVD